MESDYSFSNIYILGNCHFNIFISDSKVLIKIINRKRFSLEISEKVHPKLHTSFQLTNNITYILFESYLHKVFILISTNQSSSFYFKRPSLQ